LSSEKKIAKSILNMLFRGLLVIRTYIIRTKDLADTIKEPYFRVIDFFYKLDEQKCQHQIYKSVSLYRKANSKIDVKLNEINRIGYKL
jgi:hypothetical protein